MEQARHSASAVSDTRGEAVWRVSVESELEPLLPAFIENRWRDLETLKQRIAVSDFEGLERLGHNLQGVPGAFGFDYLVRLGRLIEIGARHRSLKSLRRLVGRFERFMRHHTICWV